MIDNNDRLDIKPCQRCGSIAEQIINTERNERLGWWCIVCNNFEDAILREKVWVKKVGKLNGYNHD
jgi:hypothetical protein|tara:strand:+ start:95 stop:292 length:198 start_codon:yes stop_codon:yes gene_type:complete